MRSSTFTFKASDGQEIFVNRWEPDEGAPVRALIHIVHGMAEHGARYARLAERLTSAGYAVYANDHRGHGRTATTDRDLGFFASSGGWARVVRDLDELIDREKREQPGNVPVAMLGHSMGSYMVQTFLFQYPSVASAAMLTGSAGKPNVLGEAGRFVARIERARLGERGKSPVIKALTFDAFNKAFAPNRTGFDWLTRDASEVDKYVADDRCGFTCSNALWIDVLDALKENAEPQNLARVQKDLPVYIASGSDDPAGERTASVLRLVDAYRQAGLFRVTHRFYEGARHEIINETNREEIMNDLISWLGKNLP